ncbi:S66 peptidase family protein [Halalkalibacillus halophilus]|uniref:S66 peptidase family protein n=1 Tax=Halalkalibacillus halophilus TaxID=392827 RepID=UPI0004897B72|nr:LD-carboxypeptidase [Halalkalibacillus halophilus]
MAMLPNALKRGDTIGVIAPSSPPNVKNMQQAILFFDQLGLQIKFGKHVEKVHGYLAGTDDERLEDLHEMFADESISGIFCAGGGYGTGRIADRIDYDLIRKNPKVFWGYSDITYLHTAFRQKTGLTTFHGPMLASDIGKDNFHHASREAFDQLFEPQTIVYDQDVTALEVLAEGEASGEIVGGNLSLLVNSLGSPYELDTKGKLLFIEDIDEEPYRIDSFLSQLKNAGKLEDASGVIVGDFNNAVAKKEPSLSFQQVLDDYFSNLNKPVISGFKIGHCQPHYAIPFGTKSTLSSENKQLTINPGVK